MIKKIILSALTALSLTTFAAETLPSVTLSGDLGGKLDGTAWSSDSLKGKVHIVFYVDPDHKDLNEDVAEALRAENFSLEKYQSLAIINMDATWLPNGVIASSLKKKQEKFPNTIYVKDLDKVLVKKWGLKDNSYCIVVLDKEGKVLLKYEDKLSEEQKVNLISLIKSNL